MAIVLFGGSFDPVHNGHVAMVQAAKAALPEAEVLVLPAACSPFKTQTTEGEEAHRLAMCRLAFGSLAEVSDVEFHLPTPSYTVQTLTHLLSVRPEEYWFLCGADAFLSLPRWRDFDTLVTLTRFLVVQRGDPSEELKTLLRQIDRQGLGARLIPMPRQDISSTQVREAVMNGKSLAGLVPPAVEDYILKNHLYGRQ